MEGQSFRYAFKTEGLLFHKTSLMRQKRVKKNNENSTFTVTCSVRVVVTVAVSLTVTVKITVTVKNIANNCSFSFFSFGQAIDKPCGGVLE